MFETPITDDPSIDDLPPEQRYRVCCAMGMAGIADDRWFEANPHRQTFIRFVLPNELPQAKPNENWLAVLRRGEPGDPDRRYIRWSGNTAPTDEMLHGEEVATVFYELCIENAGRPFTNHEIGWRLLSKLSKRHRNSSV